MNAEALQHKKDHDADDADDASEAVTEEVGKAGDIRNFLKRGGGYGKSGGAQDEEKKVSTHADTLT
jgi:hypothetical protein